MKRFLALLLFIFLFASSVQAIPPGGGGAGTGDFKADGSVPMTSNLNLGNNNITNGGVGNFSSVVVGTTSPGSITNDGGVIKITNNGGSAYTPAASDHNHTGTYQPSDADLTAIAALACPDDKILKRISGVWDCGDDTGGSGTGDVTGPASSTDNHAACFDGGSGKILKDCGGVLATDNSTASHALIKDSSGNIANSTATDTELSYVHGVTSAIQTQLDAKLPLVGGTMTGPIAGYQLVINTTGLTQDNVYYRTSGGTWAQADANGTETYPARCYAISTTQCMVSGMYTKTSHGFTVGANLYLSDTAGEMSNTTSTTTVQSLGWALDANTLVLNIGGDYAQP